MLSNILFVLQDVVISHSEGSDESADSDADSDNFSVEFEVESINSDAYSENDEDSLPGENEVSTQTLVLFGERLTDDLTNLTCLTVINSLQFCICLFRCMKSQSLLRMKICLMRIPR